MIYDNYIGCKRPNFSGHDTFPLRYGWLKKVHDKISENSEKPLSIKDIFNDPASISSFGVGKNMVTAMRYWSNHAGIIDDNGLTELAKDFFSDTGHDPYMEYTETLWLIHYNIVKNPNLITYHWFFNYYNGGAFDKKLLINEIVELCKKNKWNLPSPITLKKDIDCFIRSYVSKNSSPNNYTDEYIECPLSELGLIKQINSQTFMPNRQTEKAISPALFLYILLDFWNSAYKNEASLSFESTLYDSGSPGRIFLMDGNTVYLNINDMVKTYSNWVSWSETAGMKQLTLNSRKNISDMKNQAYKQLKQGYNV